VEKLPPFCGAPGSTPVMNGAEMDAIVAFLKTLNDWYSPIR